MNRTTTTLDREPLADVEALVATIETLRAGGADHEGARGVTRRDLVRRFADCVLRLSAADDPTRASRELELALTERLAALETPDEPRRREG